MFEVKVGGVMRVLERARRCDKSTVTNVLSLFRLNNRRPRSAASYLPERRRVRRRETCVCWPLADTDWWRSTGPRTRTRARRTPFQRRCLHPIWSSIAIRRTPSPSTRKSLPTRPVKTNCPLPRR